MPSSTPKQRRTMAAAEHGATFPLAKKLRATMTPAQLHDFARGTIGSLATAKPAPLAKPGVGHPHANLGPYLHKSKRR